MGSRGARAVLLLLALFASAPQARAQSLEYPVKANYLVRFAAFVDWRPEAFAEGGPFVICVLGRDPFGRALDEAAAGQNAAGRRIVVRRPGADATGCHIVYLGQGAPAIAATGGVLLVSDSAVSSRRGMIHFVVLDNRVRFHIDEAAAARAGLTINSRLLNLAVTVRARS